jgi:mRNA-degrading endonuclease toxin of MazEF toxin-antitoxin module
MPTIRTIPTEIVLAEHDGMPQACAANFDTMQTVPKGNIRDRITRLKSHRMKEAAAVTSFALGFDDE